MENQRNSLLHMQNKWGLTALSIILCVVLSPVLGVALFVPQVLTVLPVLLLVLLGYVGPVSAAGCTAVLIVLCGSLFGVWGAVCGALLLLPVMIVSILVLERGQSFWQSVAAGGVTFFASMGVVAALLSLLAGSDVVTALMQFVRSSFESMGTVGDTLLTLMMQMGVLAAPEGVDLSAGVAALDPAVRGEMINSLLNVTDSVMRLEIPMQMATGAVAAGLLGQAVLRKGMLSRGVKVEYPCLRTWRVPGGWGRILGGTFAVLYLLANLVPQSMNTMFYVFSGVFDQLFALQGIAAVCYLLHERGKSPVWQRVVFVVGYFFLSTAAVLVGIADQAFDFTHRREKLDKLENPFDPRRGK